MHSRLGHLFVLASAWVMLGIAPAVLAAGQPERASGGPLVIYVLGMDSQFEGSWSTGPDTLSNLNQWIPTFIRGADFAVFSYSGRYADPSQQHLALYGKEDTCGRVFSYSLMFEQWYDQVSQGHSEVHVIAHSMGGVVALYAMADRFWSPTGLASITTVESPLKGVALAPWAQYYPFDACSSADALRYQDLTPTSFVIEAIQNLDPSVTSRLATAGNAQDGLVPAGRSSLPEAWLNTTYDVTCIKALGHGCLLGGYWGSQTISVNLSHGAGVGYLGKDTCMGASVTLKGTWGDDVLRGTPGNDVISGSRGKDRLLGLAGHDRLCGGNGRNTLDGGSGDDSLLGGRGNELLIGGEGNDWLEGAGGIDRYQGGPGFDVCFPGFLESAESCED